MIAKCSTSKYPFLFYPGYGLGKQFTQHHEVTTKETTQESEQDIAGDDTRHLVSGEHFISYKC